MNAQQRLKLYALRNGLTAQDMEELTLIVTQAKMEQNEASTQTQRQQYEELLLARADLAASRRDCLAWMGRVGG